MQRPLLACVPDQTFPHADLVALLGALHALYVPLEVCFPSMEVNCHLVFSLMFYITHFPAFASFVIVLP